MDEKIKVDETIKEANKLFKIKKYKEAAGKYQEAVNMGSSDASLELAHMIEHNLGNIRTSMPEYNFNYALKLYEKAWLGGRIPYNEFLKIREDYKRMKISTDTDTDNDTDHNGGYKKRKSNRKRPSKRTRTRKHKWSLKYKRSINCKHPKGFSQRQHCKYGRKNWTRKR